MSEQSSEAVKQSQNRNPDYQLVCDGTDDDPHMIEMEFVADAATPHWECPKCGSRSHVHGEQVINL